MNTVIFSQASIFHLYRLGHLVFAATGVRHRLSDELAVMMLIKHSATCNDNCIQQQFSAFLSTVEDDTIAYLITERIIPPSYRQLSNITHVA